MRVVYKYVLKPRKYATVQMPLDSHYLCVATQVDNGREELCIWADCDPATPLVDHLFHIYGTGHPIDDVVGPYIGTAHFTTTRLVFHVYRNA